MDVAILLVGTKLTLKDESFIRNLVVGLVISSGFIKDWRATSFDMRPHRRVIGASLASVLRLTDEDFFSKINSITNSIVK